MNLAWNTNFFWDGRAASLEEQAGKPIENPDEMDLPIDRRWRASPPMPAMRLLSMSPTASPINELSLRQAIASFVRVLVSAGSPYDRHLQGDDSAFGDAERRGEDDLHVREGQLLSLPSAGHADQPGLLQQRQLPGGRGPGRQALTGRTGDLGKFKVPGLRNVAASAPYMHDGSLATLDEVIDQYARGGNGNPATDPTIVPLDLSGGDRQDLLAFLNALTDPDFSRIRSGPPPR